ncbi:MAG: serine/threonine protein kinase [Acidobacteria bacterium]|nr:serine/threonine protein kinase [Acidobacteriota bacterium]
MDGPSRWQLIDTLFHDALERPAADRAAYLASACDDLAIRTEVEAMLSMEASDRPLAIERLVNDAPLADGRPDPFIGRRLGPWRIDDVLGQGGMGTVYLASRADGRYTQQVALKLVPGAATTRGGSRFAVEAEALGRLSHPNIAHLIDAGTTPEGSPYLVMEYVAGQPITEWCDARRVDVPARVALVRVACEATQHAHQALVVHRDLKPSNIFVTGSGEVKLLDFGIAKLMEPDGGATTTVSGWHALTPAYSAPEQRAGEPVTTATDVFVLGAVLYELLTGLRPDVEGSVMAPSRAVRSLATTSAHEAQAAASARNSTPARLARLLAGDIDRVVLKALAPEPARRYGTAGQFADDLANLLTGRAVMARPDTMTYRVRRFLTRHRWGTGVAAVFAIALVIFGVSSVQQARAIAAERDRAQAQARRAERVSRLLGELISLAGPGAGASGQVAGQMLLERGTERIAAELVGDPEAQGALFTLIGTVYGDLSLHARGVAVLDRALALQRAAYPDGSLAEAATLVQLGSLLLQQNDYPGARRHLEAALALQRRLDAPASEWATTLVTLGRVLGFDNDPATALPLLQEAVEIRRREPASRPAELMRAVYELGMAHHRQGQLEPAEALFVESVEIGRGITEPSPARYDALLGLARLRHQFQRQAAAAEPIYREALALARTIYPADHQDIGTCLGELARDVRDQGRLEEAEGYAREAMAMFTRLYGQDHRETVISTQTLAGILRAQTRLADAERTQREALAGARVALGSSHPLTFSALRVLAEILEAQQRWPEAYAVRQEEVKLAAGAAGGRDVYAAIAWTGLAEHLIRAGRPGDALPPLRQALEIRRGLHPPGHRRIADAEGALAAAEAQARTRAGAAARPD